MNAELGGMMHISSNHDSHSHMWAAETMSHYLEFLKTEIRRKRQSLQLDATHKALVLCDAASVHSTARFAKIRKTFEKEANAILIHGKDEDGDGLHIPGGWGAAGAPNDAWHQFFHSIRRSWMRVASGSADIAALRRVLHTTELSVDGNPRFEPSARNTVQYSILQYCIVVLYCTLYCTVQCRLLYHKVL
ncbi:unnamed protein product [Symbiodinium sp. CCMP2592]|nr:unnamed protein product [Symbiodinium sp. CCMP2592]CAE7388432.1 unnamed protein product [Symbiodinium sp. CCMP2592]CAE7438945.1 unnamed protein product [Symbiodinium sp. CCMP2592]